MFDLRFLERGESKELGNGVGRVSSLILHSPALPVSDKISSLKSRKLVRQR